MSIFNYSFRITILILLNLSICLSSCTDSDSIQKRTIRGNLDLWAFSNFGKLVFDSVSEEDLRSVHIAGAGQLNHDVIVSGKVEILGDLGTYLVLSDGSARMLVDTTFTNAYGASKPPKVGSNLKVHGIIKSAENGHIYILASAARQGRAIKK